ncbi:MAG TPA: antitoxin Xre/MbcA/ParS toxin-binding domain-containing protein [Edaphobacter sp.]|nr:antitoxin Xre/MbcA/ParS toxin-binding domain-containing protein [Edaphobacter sp.]
MAIQTKAKTVTEAQSKAGRRNVRFNTRGASLGLRSTSTPKLIEQLEAGLSFAALETLDTNSGLGITMLATLIGIPDRTLSRPKSVGRLGPEESERLLRVSNIFEKAAELFDGDAESAVQWLTIPKKALGGQRPIQYSRTEPGAREVENLIGRLELGVFA